jgi:signal transduction histidine kinase
MIYHNIYSIGSIIPGLFGLILGILLLQVKQKSKATLILGVGYILLSFFYSGYIIATAFYHPLAAYHRFLTLSTFFLSSSAFILFFFYFPYEKNTVFGKVFIFIYLTLSLISFTIFAVQAVFFADIVFDFQSHTYDFSQSFIERVLAIQVIIGIFILLFVSIWRFIVTKEVERWACLFLGLSLFASIFIPGITNALSRYGLLSREIYLISQDLSSLFGFFTVILIYINTTKDRTTFVIKTTAVAIASLLLIFQMISYFTLKDIAAGYRSTRTEQSKLVVKGEEPPDDLMFIISNSRGVFETEYIRGDVTLTILDEIANELYLTTSDFPYFSPYNSGEAALFRIVGSGKIYLFAYDYKSYRQFLDKSARILVIILFLAITGILLGYRFFFLNSILTPLRKLKEGMEAIESGNLDVTLKIHVEDEIGFMTHSFNKMAQRLSTTEAELSDHVKNLEEKVAERTKELEQSLVELKEAQKKIIESEKMKSLTNLVSGVAHEINTPIGICITSASYLSEVTTHVEQLFKMGKFKKRDMIDFLENTVSSIDLLVGNLKKADQLIQSFKRLAVNQFTEKLQQFNVKEKILILIHPMQNELTSKGHKLTFNCADSISIESYPSAFEQIIRHLITNSINHGFDKLENRSVNLSITLEDSAILFDYSDNGKGMNQEQIDHIFEPFYTTRRGQSSVGLGMNIVYNLVNHLFQGTIEVESREENGVNVKIRIPVRQPQDNNLVTENI